MLSDAQRQAMTARLRRAQGGAQPGIARRAAGTTDLPLSFGQEQLWFMDRFAPGLPTYNIAYCLRLRGDLDAGALRRALGALLARHEALRTRLVSGADGRPHQVVDEPAGVALTEVDLSGADEPEERLRELAEAEAVRPFSLADGPLFRTHLVRVAGTEHVLIVAVHHAVYDGWSIGLMARELGVLYGAEVRGEEPELEELPLQFADYALWERERLQGPVLEELAAYWRKNLDGFQTLQLHTDRPRPLVASYEGGNERLDLGPDLLAGLRELSRREGATLFATLLAALQALLHRYTGQDDIVVGTVSANRGRAKLAPLIGFLVNTLAVRTDVSGDPAFRELLGRVRETTVEAYAHQNLPFAKLVEELKVERDPGRAPIFQVAMTLIEEPEEISAAGLTMRMEKIDFSVAKFDLAFLAEIRSGGLWLELAYATALFDAATARRLLENLRVLLRGAVEDPSRRLSQLPVLSEAELHRELVEWNDTAVELPSMCLHEGFERQVVRTPDGVAAEMGGVPVTYAELNADANRVARRLRALGVESETLVGVSMAPAPRRLAVLLGIMKAGGGYVPLDPALPDERLSYMVEDTGMPVIVADAASEPRLPATAATVVSLDREWAEITALDAADLGLETPVASVAYVIYTSGSTGRPKGVVVEHRQAVNHALGMIRHWPVSPDDRVLQFASLNFDVSVMDMFVTLLSGARAVVAPTETLHSPPRLAELMRERRVTFASLPPAVVNLLSGQEFPDLKILMPAGEALSPELVRAWVRPGLRLVNGYGPTEDTVIATFAELDGTVLPPPIGRPVANAQAYVLDRYLNPVPVGVVGELHMGGAGVTRGYLNAPELTEQRFVPDPFSDEPGARLYKTGDLVRRLPGGDIVYLGRVDGQVKIRGLRVELGEIETGLLSHPAVAQAVVVVAEDRSGERQLVGHVRLDGTATVADLRLHLADRLPAYMVPAYLVVLDAFPLNTSGKIDKSALPAPDAAGEAAAYVAPRTPAETVLTEVYASLLRRERVGIDDGFFDLGGNSLQAMQLITRLRADLDVDLGVTEVFLAPSPRELAARIARVRDAVPAGGPLVALNDGPDATPLFVVHAVGGTVHAYAPLARELAGSFRVYGVEAPGLAEATTPVDSLEAMADAYAEAITAACPDGPYRLAGWSMGGVLAYEIARRFEAAGRPVAFLGLLDAPFTLPARPDGTPEARFAADAAATLGRAAEEVSGDPLGWLAEHLDAGAGDATAVRAEIGRRFAVFQAHTTALAGYRPRGAVRADTLVVSALRSPNAEAARHWAGLAEGSVRAVCVDSDHYAFLRPPLVREVCEPILKWASEQPS